MQQVEMYAILGQDSNTANTENQNTYTQLVSPKSKKNCFILYIGVSLVALSPNIECKQLKYR